MRRRRLARRGVKVVATVVVASGILVGTGGAQQTAASGEWRSYSGDLGSTKHSSLDQINASNVNNLRIVWRHPAVDPALKQKYPKLVGTNYYRATPLMVGGSLYVQNGLGFAQALDGATGNELWTQEPLTNDLQGLAGAPPSRGVAYWRDPGSSSSASGAGTTADTADGDRILSVRRNYLFALSAKTGRPFADFGDNGKVDLSVGLRPPVTQYTWAGAPLVVRDVVVIGANGQDFPTRKQASPGDVRAYDVRTGKLRWTFNVIPRPGEFGNETWEDDSWSYTGNTNLWSMISADPDLGYVYLPLSSPTNDWYGGHRPGNNLFSDALVCVEAETGKRVWHFQMVHQVGRSAHEARLRVRLRSRDGTAGVADRGAAGAAVDCAGRKDFADPAIPDQAAGLHAARPYRKRSDRFHAGASRRSKGDRRPIRAWSSVHATARRRRNEGDAPGSKLGRRGGLERRRVRSGYRVALRTFDSGGNDLRAQGGRPEDHGLPLSESVLSRRA
jgi:outer membrane protein assembly factor BamB